MVSVLFGCLRTVFSSQSDLPMLQIFENLQIHFCLLTKRREDHKPGPPSILISQPGAKARKAQARPACQAHLAPTTARPASSLRSSGLGFPQIHLSNPQRLSTPIDIVQVHPVGRLAKSTGGGG
ncbi:hypothetical protein RB213_002637 [Colletotrichum asianum]